MRVSSKTEPPQAARFLEQVLLVNLLVHVLALVGTVLFLQPGLPGGSIDDAGRITYLSAHPWLWRWGWLFWQLSAMLDLLMGVALWRTAWIPRLPAAVVLLFTVLAIIPDQRGQALWVTRGLDLAAQAERGGDPKPYLQIEASIVRQIFVWGGSLYVCMALAWSWCFATARTWSRTLTLVSIVAWSALAIGSAGLLLPGNYQPSPRVTWTANAVGFVLLIVWLASTAEQVLRRARPDESHGRMAPWRHPWRGSFGRLLDLLANSRLLRAYGEWLTPATILSDITDAIYINYLVEAERLEPFVPAGLELQRLGRGGRYALLTLLVFRHGHFGPRFLGPLRRLMPSPLGCNCRIYVYDPSSGLPGVYFITNATDSTPCALAVRWLSEGMPMHPLRRAALHISEDRVCRIRLDAGGGSGPDVEAVLRLDAPTHLGSPWNECFDNYRALLSYCVSQDRAFSVQPWYGRITRQEVVLGIALENCEPLQGEVHSAASAALVGETVPLCFRFARIALCFVREEHARRVREPLALRLGVAQAHLSLSPVSGTGSVEGESRLLVCTGDRP